MAELPKVYVEPGAEDRLKPVFMTDDVYEQASRSMIIDCTDVLLYDRGRRVIWLATRRLKPMSGLWVIGGRRKPGETPAQSALRCFERETKVKLEPSRLMFLTENEYIWKDRQQEPQDVGCHVVARVFGVLVSDAEELAQMQRGLHPAEYDVEAGLQAFSREGLVRANAHPALIDLYDAARKKFE